MKDDIVSQNLCYVLEELQANIIDSVYDVLLLEHCQFPLAGIINLFMRVIFESEGKQLESHIENFIKFLDRILFQIIFTLAIIQDDYAGFLHGDMFVRNILVSVEKSFKSNDYVAYHYKQKIFYLLANEDYAKINDFGMSILIDELEPSTYRMYEYRNKFYHVNPFNHKTDIFNLLHDIYSGQNLGSTSIIQWAIDKNIPYAKIEPLRKFLSKFIKVKTIDEINSINYHLLSDTWHIDNIKILEDSVSTPDQYLMGNHFKKFQKLPPKSKVVRHFNEPK